MRIMTYNILTGGMDSGASRIEEIIDVINKVKPDFLAIQEANNFEKNDGQLLKRISEETNLPHYAFSQYISDDDTEHYSVANFSTHLIKNEYSFPESSFSHAVLTTTIDSPIGEITLCNVHLNTNSEDKRLKEVDMVLNYLSKFEKNIVLGDFNALSRSDHYIDLSKEEFTHYDLNRFEVTDLLNKNHVDTALCLNKNNMRTHPTIGIGHPISKNPIRIDYMFVSQSLVNHLKDTALIKTSAAEIASDHYPIILTLE